MHSSWTFYHQKIFRLHLFIRASAYISVVGATLVSIASKFTRILECRIHFLICANLSALDNSKIVSSALKTCKNQQRQEDLKDTKKDKTLSLFELKCKTSMNLQEPCASTKRREKKLSLDSQDSIKSDSSSGSATMNEGGEAVSPLSLSYLITGIPPNSVRVTHFGSVS